MPGKPLFPKTDAEDTGVMGTPFLTPPQGEADVEPCHSFFSISKFPFQRETGEVVDHVCRPRAGELINTERRERQESYSREHPIEQW